MKHYRWHKIADNIKEIAFSESGTAEVNISGKKICVAFFKDNIAACMYKCPHAGGNMADGYIDSLGNIVCPLHRYKFNLKSGRNISGEGYFLKIYPVEKRGDGIFVGIEENNLSD